MLLGVQLAVLLLPAGVVARAALEPGPAGAGAVADAGRNEADGSPGDAAARPSIHFEQALEHAADELDFEPGDRVTAPFTPRAGDTWTIDGRPPRPLPAGHSSGAELRAAPAAAIWAKGRPPGPSDAPQAPDLGSDLDLPAGDITAIADPASVVLGPSASTEAAAPVSSNGLRREVFGFLPYWAVGDSTTTLDWKTLSTVAYFSVGCTSTGGLDKVNPNGSLTSGWGGWTSARMTSIINAAHQNQTRVVLTISCFAWTTGGAERQAAVLGSASARANLAKAAAAAVRDRGADGINLDFEPIVAGYADEFTLLVKRMRTELNAIAPGYQLTFDTLGSIGNQPIAEATAPGGADAIFIMGYDYRTDGSSVAGSISPLTGPRYDLTDTIKAYTALVPASKLILGVPYYGRAWSTASDNLNAPTLSPAKFGAPAAPTYLQALDLVAQHGRRYDAIEQAPWTAYQKQTCTTTYGCLTSWRELYYDDPASLKLRYDLVNRQGLRGAGIWALGYEGTRTDLRTALADKFLLDRTPPIVGVATLTEAQRDEGFSVAWTAYDDSSIIGYDVEVATNGGPWLRWLTATTATSSTYLGANGSTYAFRVRATDIHGNVAGWHAGSLGSATAVPAAIEVGGYAAVVVDGLRMRANPATDATAMTTLPAGAALHVIGGPVTGAGYTWWQVVGPLKQWAPVETVQVGGWIAASGNGVTNAVARRAPYVTRVAAGITGLTLNGGGVRALTPNGDGTHDELPIAWTNHGAFDSVSMRVHRLDGTLAGSASTGGTADGNHVWTWDGTLGGVPVPAGTYVIQLQGLRGATAYSAPSASPVTPVQVARVGVVLGTNPTSVTAFKSNPSWPTTRPTIRFDVTFAGPVTGFAEGDVLRSGSASGCVVGAPVGAGTSWSVSLTSCGAGTVSLAVKAGAVVDAVSNAGPATNAAGPTVIIDRSAPTANRPKVVIRPGGTLSSTMQSAGLPATLSWSAREYGLAGIKDYDVRRSVDGGAFKDLAVDTAATSMPITLTPGHTYRFEVRARDKAGNVSGWVASSSMSAGIVQESNRAIAYTGTWGRAVHAQASGLASRYAATPGASARYAFTGRGIAVVVTRSPVRGAVKVYVDGGYVTTIDTYAESPSHRSIVFSRTWASSGSHTIRLVVVGTAGRARVDLDAFQVLR